MIDLAKEMVYRKRASIYFQKVDTVKNKTSKISPRNRDISIKSDYSILQTKYQLGLKTLHQLRLYRET